MKLEELSEAARTAIKSGSMKMRLKRAGMFQVQTFTIRRVRLGNDEFVELFLGKVVDIGELTRLANEAGLPIEAENGRAFPSGRGAVDYAGL